MMRFLYDGYGMMSGGGIIVTLTWLVIFIDLVLLGFWLWKQVKK